MLFVLLLALSLSFVSAVEDNSTDCDASDEIGNFSQLNEEIANSTDYLNLTKSYSYADDDENIDINKSMAIEGNSHSITVNSAVFKINGNNTVTFNNINFIVLHEIKLNTTSNVTFFNCSFDMNSQSNFVCPSNYLNERGVTGTISQDIIDLAKSIVGNSKDLEAAKKLAVWVGKNIVHESRAGFYQTPSETVARGFGNCCSQTDLFLQMCEVIGITKTHRVYYVHVGYINFGYRHFFAMIDNLVVDVDARPNSPWGHASLIRKVFAVTPYPILPISRAYN